MKKECQHGEWYSVKRLRMLNYLINEKGMYPVYQKPDPNNPKYFWFMYKNTPELEEAIKDYFNEIMKK